MTYKIYTIYTTYTTYKIYKPHPPPKKKVSGIAMGVAMPLEGWVGWVGLGLWAKMDSNHRRYKPADLQSAPFGHSGIRPVEMPLHLICDCKYMHYFLYRSIFFVKKPKNCCKTGFIPYRARAARNHASLSPPRLPRLPCRPSGRRNGRAHPALCPPSARRISLEYRSRH